MWHAIRDHHVWRQLLPTWCSKVLPESFFLPPLEIWGSVSINWRCLLNSINRWFDQLQSPTRILWRILNSMIVWLSPTVVGDYNSDVETHNMCHVWRVNLRPMSFWICTVDGHPRSTHLGHVSHSHKFLAVPSWLVLYFLVALLLSFLPWQCYSSLCHHRWHS